MFKFFVILLLLLILMATCGGCAGVVALPGAFGATAATSESYATYKTITAMKAGVDISLATSGLKTTNDIIVSTLTGKDCRIYRQLTEGKMCEDKTSINGWELHIPTADKSNETN
jgi:Na+/glutamate symporter